MSIILWGQYPRSEALVQATRDHDRDRITNKQLERTIEEDRKNLLTLQKGFPYPSSGQLHWDDLIRPIAKLSPDLITGSLTRFFETNTFWRTLESTDTPKLDLEQTDPWIKNYFPDTNNYTFPFWFLFRHFSKGKLNIDFLFPLFKQLPKGLLLFVEPTFGWKEISKKEKEKAHAFLEKLKQKTSHKIALITLFHSIEQEKEYLYQLPVDGIGIDFYHNTIEETLNDFSEDKFLIAGVLDTESTQLEEKSQFTHFTDYVPKERLYYSHSGPAELLPRKVMDAKIDHLQKALS